MGEPGKQIGRYVIVREIGRGGMAAVYLARQVDLDRDVALKELNTFHAADPAFAERFVRESRVAGSMNHPNIVTVYEFLTADGVPYIAMEYLDRGSLRGYVRTTSLAQTIGVLEGALAGLAQAERREIVHRDIKPENLMVTDDGEVKIADFGIAKALTEAGGPNLTATGSTVGTPAYMSPEQATAGTLGPWTDLYSIGITAYEMTVGRVPFHDAETPVTVMLRHVNEDIPSAASIDPAVDSRFSDWIDRLLVKDPQGRTQSARQAWYELEEIAVAVLGPMWRRDARLVGPGGETGAAPLTPAPFGGDTPPQEPAAPEYVTYAGGAAAASQPPAPSPQPPAPPPAAPPPAPPPQTPAPVGESTIPPSPPAEAAEEASDPGHTVAPEAAPPPETVEPPSPGGSRRGLAIGVVVVVGVVAAGLAVWSATRGSGKSAQSTTTSPPPPSHSVPKVTANKSGFQPGLVVSIAPYHGHAWGIIHNPPNDPAHAIVDVQQRSAAAIQTGPNTHSLAFGDNALWVSSTTSNGRAQIQKVVPEPTATFGARIPFRGEPANPRAVVAHGTIWQPIDGGLLKIPEHGGPSTRVNGITFTPDSVELIGGAIWATDGKAKLVQVPVDGPTPTAKPYHVPGAGWVTGNANSLYVTTKTGVSKIDPANPTKPASSVPHISRPPDRIALIGDILWTTTYTQPPDSDSMTVTLVGFDVKNGRKTNTVVFKAPPKRQPSKLVEVDHTFWLTALGGAHDRTVGLQPFHITGG